MTTDQKISNYSELTATTSSIIKSLHVPRNHKLLYSSSYDRGAEHLLKVWPEIKEKFKDAELHLCYGWDTFDAIFRDNPERQSYKKRMETMMRFDGIKHHGRLSKSDLRKVHEMCGIWAYPSHFQEINCISALNAQKMGLVPVTMDNFALKETVGSGSKVEGDIYDQETKDKWLAELFKYMGDEKLWEQESKKAIKFASDYSWDKLAGEWTRYFV